MRVLAPQHSYLQTLLLRSLRIQFWLALQPSVTLPRLHRRLCAHFSLSEPQPVRALAPTHSYLHSLLCVAYVFNSGTHFNQLNTAAAAPPLVSTRRF